MVIPADGDGDGDEMMMVVMMLMRMMLMRMLLCPQKLQQERILDHTLSELYEVGHNTDWSVPS